MAAPGRVGGVWRLVSPVRLRRGGGGLAAGGWTGALIQADELLAPDMAVWCCGLGRGVRVGVERGDVCRVAASCGRKVGCHAVGGVGFPTIGRCVGVSDP